MLHPLVLLTSVVVLDTKHYVMISVRFSHISWHHVCVEEVKTAVSSALRLTFLWECILVSGRRLCHFCITPHIEHVSQVLVWQWSHHFFSACCRILLSDLQPWKLETEFENSSWNLWFSSSVYVNGPKNWLNHLMNCLSPSLRSWSVPVPRIPLVAGEFIITNSLWFMWIYELLM